MSDALRKVKNGDPLVIPATANNAMLEPSVMARKTTNTANLIWNLTPYLEPGKARNGSTHWSIIERSDRLQYGNGTVDGDGRLTGLPPEFRSGYSYNGYMRLEIGCLQENGSIKWPE